MITETILEIIVGNYVELISKIIKKIKVSLNLGFVSVSLGDDTKSSIDERIIKIDEARNNLLEGIKAIDELREEADKNKAESQLAIEQIAALAKDKTSLENELISIKNIINSDIQSFQKIAGVPSPKQIRKERILGFFSGVLASIVAAAIIWIVTIFFQ